MSIFDKSYNDRLRDKEKFYMQVIAAWQTSESRSEAEKKMVTIPGFGQSSRGGMLQGSARKIMSGYVQRLRDKDVNLKHLPAEPQANVNWSHLADYAVSGDITFNMSSSSASNQLNLGSYAATFSEEN